MAAPQKKCPECKAGAPDWMVTFSDLMTLLLTFFVLLLSMAIIEEPKFERVASSLHEAFNGVKVIGKSVEKIIEDPNKIPSASPVRVVEDDNQDILTKNKDFDEPADPNTAKTQGDSDKKHQQMSKMLEYLEEAIQDSLTKEIDTGVAEIEKQEDQILLRFPSEATFKSGSADLNPKMQKTFQKLAGILKGKSVTSVITGHTDDVPISTAQYRSNWDLSAARASSIAMEFQNYGAMRSEQIEVVGYADGVPIAPNDSPENRRVNRRIEVFITPYEQGFDDKVFETVVGTVESANFTKSLKIPDTLQGEKVKKDQIETDSINVDKKENRLGEIIERVRSFNRRRK